MSRNRCTTDCACGLWSFQTERFFAPGDPSLLTEEAYFQAIGWPDCPYRPSADPEHAAKGYGYRADLVGDCYRYLDPAEAGQKYRGSSFGGGPHGRFTEPELACRYLDVPPEDRYRYRRLDCVFCCRPYKVETGRWLLSLPPHPAGAFLIIETRPATHSNDIARWVNRLPESYAYWVGLDRLTLDGLTITEAEPFDTGFDFMLVWED